MAKIKTSGVKLTFAKDDASWNKSLTGLGADVISDTATAKTFCKSVAKLVDGSLTAVDYIETTPVDID